MSFRSKIQGIFRRSDRKVVSVIDDDWQVQADHPILARPDRVFHGENAEARARLFAKELKEAGFENIVVSPWRVK